MRAAQYWLEKERIEEQWIAHSLRQYGKDSDASTVRASLEAAERELDHRYEDVED